MDIGAPELLVILVIVLLIMGPGRLPDVGAALGRTLREFRQALRADDDQTKLNQSDQQQNSSKPA